ncbi:MAG: hypothetical protein J0L58_10375 [Burkholderiales bacterium]|nr:hypothetical protein [Burkholderiales bacterium]
MTNNLKAAISGKEFPVTATRVATAASIARAMAGILKGVTLVGAVALAAENARCHFGSDGWSCDWGQPQEPLPSWCDASNRCYETAIAGFSAQWSEFKLNIGDHLVRSGPLCEPADYGRQNCVLVFSYLNPNGTPQPQQQVFAQQFRPEVTTRCPDGTERLRGGESCTTPQEEWAPGSQEAVREALVPEVQKAPDSVLRDVLPHLAPGTAVKTDPATLTGPATVTQPAQTTTTTAPNGQPQTTTTQVTNNITYMGDSFSWSNTTVTNYPDGGTEVKNDPPPKDERSECEKNPESMNCQARDVPDGPPVQDKQIPISFSPDVGWGGEGQCPAPQTVSVLGQAVTIDNTVVCTFLSGIRPVVVAMFGLAGALIFIGGLKP